MTVPDSAGVRGPWPGRLRKLASALVKLALSGLLIWWAVGQVDLSAIAARLGDLSWPWLLPLAVLVLLQAALLCLRFHWVLQGALAGAVERWRFWPVARTVLAGLLFNQPFPSTLGGDVARVVLLRRMGIGLGTAFSAVVADRGAALLAMLLAMLAGLPLLAAADIAIAPADRATLVATDLVAGAVALVVIAVLLLLRHLRWLGRHHRLLERVAGLYAGIRQALVGAGRLPAILLAGIAGHFLTALFGLCVAAGLDIPLSPAVALLLIPPVLLIAQIPIAIAGWGLREAAMVTALGFAGISAGDAFLVSVGIGLATLAQGLAGGLAWSLSGAALSRRASSNPAAEEGQDIAAPL